MDKQLLDTFRVEAQLLIPWSERGNCSMISRFANLVKNSSQPGNVTDGHLVTPHCVAESDQRHAQHPLKMLGIDFSCGSYLTNSELIMLLNNLYQTDMSLYSNRYLFVRSKIGGQKWQPHILCKTMSFFASRLTPLVRLATTRTCTEDDTRRNANSNQLLSQDLRHSVLTTCAIAMKNALFRALKISEFGKWVERHNGDHVIHMTSDDVTGDRKVAQPSCVHATKSVAFATRCWDCDEQFWRIFGSDTFVIERNCW